MAADTARRASDGPEELFEGELRVSARRRRDSVFQPFD